MSRRIFLIGLVVLALVIVGRLGNRGYRAEAMVITEPFTNAFFSPSFESEVVSDVPGVLALRPVATLKMVSGAPAETNGVAIRIVTIGKTPVEAQKAANDAAAQLCRSLRTNYAIRAELAEAATASRPYSILHDRFEPAVSSLFH